MSDGKFYVTTPIYYVNFKPHIGTSYTTILTDVACRFRRFLGEDAVLVTGSDEHSQNIADLAEQAGKTPKQYCDEIIPKFLDCWKLLDIQDYRFERTSDSKHHRLVQKFWQRIFDRGDVYRGEYSGWYHTSDNRYLDPDEVPENPESHPRLKYLTEESYYFKLSAHAEWLKELHTQNPELVIPDIRRNEMLARIEGGLQDICISRTSTDWGIPLPWDDKHVFYVWVEALLTYLTGSGFDIDAFLKTIDGDRSSEVKEPLWTTERSDLISQPEDNFWPADLHVMAKDIPWFHAIIWPAMLHSFGAPPPKKLLVHGYWQFDGEKMSKSLGNVVDPYDAAELVGVDAVRYFLLREVSAGRDGNFNYEALVSRYKSDLANDLGNLVHRTVSMLHQTFEGQVPPNEQPDVASELEKTRLETIERVLEDFRCLRYSEGLQAIWGLVRLGNQTIEQFKPWEVKKKPERRSEVGSVFYGLLQSIRTICLLAYPVIPGAANRFWKTLGLAGTLEEQRDSALREEIPTGHALNKSEPVFERIDDKLEAAKKQDQTKGQKVSEEKKGDSAQATEASNEGLITIDDFTKIELRIAEVLAAEKVENADRLLKLRIHDGERERQIVAGIAQHYAPEDLPGKKLVLVANLKPAKLRGLVSEGMLLAGTDADGRLSLVTPERDISPGARVK
ncbi:MAG: methionine--tRNA ligase [Planctomycetota bacterium]